jgi:hypothetical protein
MACQAVVLALSINKRNVAARLRFISDVAASLYAALQAKAGAYGIRTRDLLNAIEALYQLS